MVNANAASPASRVLSQHRFLDVGLPQLAKYAEELVVRIRINLAPDGQLVGTPKILDTSRMRSDGFFRAAAEAARRAIQLCGKLELPVQDYDIWKEVVLNFDPSKM